MGDLNPVLARIVALRQSMFDDGIANGVPFHTNDLKTLTERLASEGSSFVKVTLPKLGKALDQGLVSGQFICSPGFRLKRDTCLPVFLGNLFGLVFRTDGILQSRPSLLSIFYLRQFLLFDSKLITEPTFDQREAAYAGFIDRQVLLRQRSIPVNHPVLLRAQKLLTHVLRDLDLSTITPGHGPGATMEHLDRAERWALPTWPSRAERFYPSSEYTSTSFTSLAATRPPVLIDKMVTRCCLVPKDYKGPRLISSESTATQYLQQGQMRAIMKYIERHSLLSQSIQLNNQMFNQRKCETAYANGAVTLDLSNASDNVSATLVWFLLKGVPHLRRLLFCTRSQSMLIDGVTIRLASFSPMGSAVCFPVETLVFWAISMASLRYVLAHSLNRESPSLRESASEVAVFGDDIIIPDYAAPTLIGTLIEVGCEVNESKTCLYTPFRESCGSEWFNCTDISITRNKRYNYDAERRVVNYPVLLDLQRKLFLQGLERTAALLREWAREIGPVLTVSVYDEIPRTCECLRPEGNRSGKLRFSLQAGRPSELVVLPHGHCSGRGIQNHTGSATALPSGLDFYVRNSASFDSLSVAIERDNSLDRGLRVRYNEDYQRIECRLPTVFQCCRKWDHQEGTSGSISDSKSFRRSTTDEYRDLKTDTVFRLSTGYPRLLARVLGDYIERIAIRGLHKPKMAWSDLSRFGLSTISS